MRTFVMGDIHGAYKALQQCLERAAFDNTTDQLIHLGDITDGYHEVYECVEALLNIKNLIAIKGNHDAWFDEFIQTGYHPAEWMQGGKATAISYLRATGKDHLLSANRNSYKTILQPEDIPVMHQAFFRNQQLYYIDDNNNCFVHGGFNRLIPIEAQLPEAYYWDRSLWSAALSFKAHRRGNVKAGVFQMATLFNEIFIGHTSTIYWKTDQPMKAANIYNIDTGAGHGERLTIMDVHSKQYWQSDLTKDLYEKNER